MLEDLPKVIAFFFQGKYLWSTVVCYDKLYKVTRPGMKNFFCYGQWHNLHSKNQTSAYTIIIEFKALDWYREKNFLPENVNIHTYMYPRRGSCNCAASLW